MRRGQPPRLAISLACAVREWTPGPSCQCPASLPIAPSVVSTTLVKPRSGAKSIWAKPPRRDAPPAKNRLPQVDQGKPTGSRPPACASGGWRRSPRAVPIASRRRAREARVTSARPVGSQSTRPAVFAPCFGCTELRASPRGRWPGSPLYREAKRKRAEARFLCSVGRRPITRRSIRPRLLPRPSWTGGYGPACPLPAP